MEDNKQLLFTSGEYRKLPSLSVIVANGALFLLACRRFFCRIPRQVSPADAPRSGQKNLRLR